MGYIPVCFHHVFPDEASYQASGLVGESGETFTADGLVNANWAFYGYEGFTRYDADSRISLVQEGPVHVIIDASWAELFEDEEQMMTIAEEMLWTHNNAGCVNFYLLPQDTPDNMNASIREGPGLGFALNYAVTGVVTTTMDPNPVLHEFGHVFGLYHTYSTAHGSSLKYPSSPYTTGDLLADTAPDPGRPGCNLYPEVNPETGELLKFLTVTQSLLTLKTQYPTPIIWPLISIGTSAYSRMNKECACIAGWISLVETSESVVILK